MLWVGMLTTNPFVSDAPDTEDMTFTRLLSPVSTRYKSAPRANAAARTPPPESATPNSLVSGLAESFERLSVGAALGRFMTSKSRPPAVHETESWQLMRRTSP